MKRVTKSFPPREFDRYCRRNGSSYKDLSENNILIKDNLRQVLLSDQGYICCYCGQTIDTKSSTIEHVKCRDNNPSLQLCFENLLCSCKGGSDKRVHTPVYPLHCGDSKKNKCIEITPLDIDCEDKFNYDEDGVILGIENKAQSTIDILNLNNAKLKHKRKYAIQSYKWLIDSDVDWSEEIEQLNLKDKDGKFQEYCLVCIKYIENYII
jgi:uncharacterized protein (TIGR02646 family)